jgi:hypothetical protein
MNIRARLFMEGCFQFQMRLSRNGPGAVRSGGRRRFHNLTTVAEG